MDGQLLAVGVIVAVAAGYVLRAAWRAARGSGCAAGCGKCATAAESPKPGRVSLPQVD